MKRRHARKGDAEFGVVCRCGGPKARQSWTCQSCHGAIRGYGLATWSGGVGPESDLLARELAAARAAADGELAELVAEQERDDRSRRWGTRRTVPLSAFEGILI